METIGMNDYKNIHLLQKIELSILGNDEVERMSVLDGWGIEHPDITDKLDIKRDSLIDTRMGITDKNVRCGTCAFGINHCLGHFGHIKLAKYVFNIGYVIFVKKILSVICIGCSKILISEKDKHRVSEYIKKKPYRIRITELKEKFIKNAQYCNECGRPVPKIKLETKSQKNINLYAEYSLVSSTEGENSQKKRQQLTSDICYALLHNISDVDCVLLGFDPQKSRPENLIYKIFPVPPVQIRPSVRIEGLAPKQDDMTVNLSEIVKANRQVKTHEANLINNYSHEYGHLLQHSIKSYYDEESTLLAKSNKKSRSKKSLVERLKGKEGRFRANLQGKRVDFSARTVITPDALMDIDQLGVPIAIARNLTIPEIVTKNNIKKLEQLVKNGRYIYPGANFVIPLEKYDKKRTIIDLRYGKNNVVLKIGDTVERQLVDDDVVMFNRQPSLHMQSMMSHRIKVIQDENIASFRLNLAVLKPYNADFDGDEMNMQVPQNIQSEYELSHLSHIKYQIISPTTCAPTIGIILDGLLGIYNMSSRNYAINWRHVMNLISPTFNKIKKFNLKKFKYYEGNDVLSFIIPKKINYPSLDDKTSSTIIKNGVITKGKIGQEFVGIGKKNNLIHNILHNYGNKKTLQFLNNCNKIAINFNLLYGFTMSPNDAYAQPDVKKQMKIMLNTRKLEICYMLTNAENNKGMVEPEELEKKIFEKLSIMTSELSKVLQNALPKENNFSIMMDSKAGKDAISRVGQIVGCVGQQVTDGKRMNVDDKFRCLNYFCQHDDTPLARGFIETPFIDGLSFPEAIFAHTVGRDGLIETSVKTSETGYLYRKMAKSQEDVVVKYDGTVRTAKNGVIQFVYGHLGIDVRKQYQHTLELIEMGDDDIENEFKFDKNELKEHTFSHNDLFCDTLKFMRDQLIFFSEKSNLDYVVLQKDYMLPINIPMLLNTVINTKYETDTVLNADYVYDNILSLLSHSNTPIYCFNDKKSIKNDDENVSKTIFKIALFYFIAPKVCIIKYKLSKEAFDDFILLSIKHFKKSIVEPGLMVGMMSAGSIGEPTTQMTISSFHSASTGIAKQGVVRIQELLDARKVIKKPMMIIYLQKEFMTNIDVANNLISYMDMVLLREMMLNMEFIYDPLFSNEKSNKMNYVFKKLSNADDYVNWLIKIDINKEKMYEKNINLLDIKRIIVENFEKKINGNKSINKEEKSMMNKISDFYVSSNDDNDEVPTVFLRIVISDDFNIKFVNSLLDFISTFKIKGMRKINGDVVYKKEPFFLLNEKTKKIEKYSQENGQFVIYTNGINLDEIRNLKFIDIYKSRCNDVNAIYETFGIEAARTVLLKELHNELSGSSNTVMQHFTILVDMMTSRGKIVSVNRHGFNKQEMDVFARASFEKSVDQLLSAAVYGETDTMDCVSSRIMAGLVVKSGTGLCDVILDNQAILNSNNTSEFLKPVSFLHSDTYINDVIHGDLDDDFHLF